MSYKGDQCGIGLCVTPAPTTCSTVRHVHEVHTYEVVPRKTRKRLPWMQPWSANCVPYSAGSLVIHCNEYWYNLCESYSPPGQNSDWTVFDPEAFFRWFHENVVGGCDTLAIPVYAREDECSARHEDPYCAPTNYKLWMKDDVVSGADGKVYVSLVDNNATFPPNVGWSAGKSLENLVHDYVLGLLSGNSQAPEVPQESATPQVFLGSTIIDVDHLQDISLTVSRQSSDISVSGSSITVQATGFYDMHLSPDPVLAVHLDSTVSGIGLTAVGSLYIYVNGTELADALQYYQAPSTSEMPAGKGTAHMTSTVILLSHLFTSGDVITLKANVSGKASSMDGKVRFTARRVA